MGRAGVIQNFIDPKLNLHESSKKRYDVSCVRCPISVYYGTNDTIIDGDTLVEELQLGSDKLVRVGVIDDYEHMDVLWSVDAEEMVWRNIVKDLKMMR